MSGLLGDWELGSIPPQRMPGISVTVTVDSVNGPRYFGGLSHYFSGNVGQDPRNYEAFVDSIREDDIVTFSMAAARSEAPGMEMRGKFDGDTIALDTFVLGPDTVTSGERRWFLVKRH